ncbi:hypothetical protein BM449_03255 [Synechococcus sp. SynAce01]|nr:hypothetical protein BM449_03255 [Synechococcus sp. SynAce01]
MPACTMRTIELTIIESASLGWERWPSSEAITRSGIEPLLAGRDPARTAGEGRWPAGDAE